MLKRLFVLLISVLMRTIAFLLFNLKYKIHIFVMFIFLVNIVFANTLNEGDLKVLKEKKFPFARFLGAIYGKYIYAVEKEGYLIATDVNLVTSNVFKFSAPFYGMSSSFDGFLFTSGDSIFYDNKQFKLAK